MVIDCTKWTPRQMDWRKPRRAIPILLDLGLPDMDGTQVITQVRSRTRMPIILLSARDQEPVKVEALDLGADDDLTKPFGLEELLTRMRVALRHANRLAGVAAERLCTFGDLRVDLGRRQVFASGRESISRRSSINY